jgi:hypothetical protein
VDWHTFPRWIWLFFALILGIAHIPDAGEKGMKKLFVLMVVLILVGTAAWADGYLGTG